MGTVKKWEWARVGLHPPNALPLRQNNSAKKDTFNYCFGVRWGSGIRDIYWS